MDQTEVRVLARSGNPARELAAAAAEHGADALVTGTPGHLWHHLAGSVPGWRGTPIAPSSSYPDP